MSEARERTREDGAGPDAGASARSPVIEPSRLIESQLVSGLRDHAGCPLLIDENLTSPQSAVDGDMAFAEALTAGDRLVRVWRNERCLVASRRQALLPTFPAARALSEAMGWPVAIRRSGGTAVAHRPGILNVSLLSALQPDQGFSVGAEYAALLAILRGVLSAISIGCDHGDVPGAHCDGRYNLRWRGRKLAGTAGSLVRSRGRSFGIFHASLVLDGAIAEDLEALRGFELTLGEARSYALDAHVSVDEILGRRPVNDL